MQLTKEHIIHLLKTNDKAIIRAIVVLNSRQTIDEQNSETTKYHNNRGVRPCHARMITSMATFYEKYHFLSAKQINYWRMPDRKGNMRIGIYAGQLLEEAQLKQAKKVES